MINVFINDFNIFLMHLVKVSCGGEGEYVFFLVNLIFVKQRVCTFFFVMDFRILVILPDSEKFECTTNLTNYVTWGEVLLFTLFTWGYPPTFHKELRVIYGRLASTDLN